MLIEQSSRDGRSLASIRKIPPSYPLWIVAILGILSYLGMIAHPSARALTPDSWSYYDLSQTVYGNFYQPATTRAFREHDGYSRSFPPLWPVLIASANRVLGQGPGTAVMLAAAAALLTLLPIKRVMDRCAPRRAFVWLASITTWLGLLWFQPYWEEAHSGCSIPVTVLLLFSAVACLVGTRRPGVTATAAAGLFLGLACLARFDSAPFAGIVLVGCAVARSLRLPSKIAICAMFAVAVSPWVLYSKRHYDSFWSSDNSAVAMSAGPAYAMDYKPPAQTIGTNPVRWARRVAVNAVRFVLVLVYSAGMHPVLPLLLAAACVLWLRRNRAAPGPQPLLMMAGAALAGLGGQVLTGYMDRRYFSFACALAAAWATCFVLRRVTAVRLTAGIAVAFLMLLAPLTTLEWVRQEFGETPPAFQLKSDELRPTAVLADLECHELGAMTRQRTVCLPSDWERLSMQDKEAFLHELRVTHALVTVSGGGPRQFQIVPMRLDLNLRTR